ncbi:MAG: HAMP domain-containing sensor histidine kinase, partial [Thermotaleaceae bacterium]
LLTSLFLDIINLYSIVSMLIYEYILMLISFIGCTVIVTKRALEGDPDAKIFSIGFTILTLSGLYDILGWYFRIVPWFTFMFMWAMLIFVLLLTYILIRRFREISNRIKTFYVEIEHKNKDLEEQQKRLEEAISYDKMKTEFFSNISHEFRTPLNIILSSIQLLHLYIEDGTFIININQTTSRLKIMQQNCYRLIRLLNNLIDITKIDSGYFALTLQNHNIVEITENITLSVADYIKSKGISLTFDTDTEEKIMACDPDLIERILLNLLSNAVKFTQPGADIWVNLYDLEDSIMIEVKDGGIGIEKDKLDGIFERFVQVDKSLSRQREGSGIGLSLVKSLVEMHGGIVTVDSEIGVGTTFSINLPAKTVNQDSFFDYISTQEISHHVEKISVEFSDIYS